jgi:hypothetical protein
MEQKPGSKLIFPIIPVTPVPIGRAVFGVLFFPAQKTYRNALTAALPHEL